MIEQYSTEIIAGGAAYVAGFGIDHLAYIRARQSERPIIEEWGIDETPQLEDLKPTRREKISGFLIRITPPIALGTGLTAALFTAGFANPPETTAPAPIEVVVDHSGATDLSIDGAPVLPAINKIADSFKASSDYYDIEAYIDTGGQTYTEKISNVDSLFLGGYAPLDDGTNKALEQAAVAKNTGKSKNSALVVITNGNPIGDPGIIIAEADKSKTPVYVVNVENS